MVVGQKRPNFVQYTLAIYIGSILGAQSLACMPGVVGPGPRFSAGERTRLTSAMGGKADLRLQAIRGRSWWGFIH